MGLVSNMRVRNKVIKKVSDGGTRRLEDTTNVSVEERDATQSIPGCDDGARPNPSNGSHVLDGPRDERSSNPLRKLTSIATWNVRSMSAGKLEIVEREMTRCDIKVLGVSELWWHGQGRFTTDDGSTCLYSGKNSGRKRMGVGFIIEKATAKSILGYNPVNERVITLRLKGKPMNLTLVQVYAPTSEASDQDMEEFYEVVQDVLDNIPKKDVTILLGDWNAKLGKSTTKTANVGTYGLGIRNERGDRLEEFCVTNNLMVGNTFFHHHPRRLWTWKSPGDCVRNQIDYIMIGNRWRSSLQNVKTRPGADCGSDHQLLAAKFRLKLKAKRSSAPPSRYDVDDIPPQFTLEVRNRFTQLLKSEEKGTNSK